LFAKFQVPTVANGKVFVPTYGDKELQKQYFPNIRPNQTPGLYYVAVYGLLPHAPHEKTIVNKDDDDVTVSKAVATAPLVLDLAGCVPAGPGNLDCTQALATKFGAPSLHQVIVPVGGSFAGCNLLRVTTARPARDRSTASSSPTWSSIRPNRPSATGIARPTTGSAGPPPSSIAAPRCWAREGAAEVARAPR
jgi:hypothetical protein